MKRYLFVLVVTLVTLGVQAGNSSFAVQEGNMGVLAQKSKTATFRYDYQNATVGGQPLLEVLKSRDQRAFDSWDNTVDVATDFFVERWNDEDGCVTMQKEGEADYQVVVYVGELNLGNTGAAMWGWGKKAGGIQFSGSLEVKDAAGVVVCVIAIDKYKGVSVRNLDMKVPTFGRRMALGAKSFAKDLCEFVTSDNRR